ncbi:MAG: M28 family peptidase, partial [Planctomycetes bacterium]|nr:M28 family peptidase [Planctomycetota bacterium]
MRHWPEERRPAIIRRMNMSRSALRPLLLLLAAPLLSQPLPAQGLAGDEGLDPATSITAAEIGEHVEVLASDLFEGREAGTRGERRAAAYLIAQLEACEALQPDGPEGEWLQPFELELHDGPATAHNVLARLPGGDPALAHEAIVVGAHYDHVGFGHNGNTLDFGVHDIHNGADDNGSGTSALLDLATSLAGSGWRPRRTLLFQWYSGEELGLLGSRHWVANPTHPIRDVVFMINMDMVGRLTGRTLVVGGTGTSPGLSDLARAACDDLGLVMIDDPPGGAPSDNSSFYEADVPALFLFTGLHPDYHRATDDSHKLDLPGARDVGRLAERLVRAIDARDARPEFRRSPGTANIFTPRRWLGAAFE